jgi:hypothetical protein
MAFPSIGRRWCQPGNGKSRQPKEQRHIYPGDIDISIYPGKYKLPKIQSFFNG